MLPKIQWHSSANGVSNLPGNDHLLHYDGECACIHALHVIDNYHLMPPVGLVTHWPKMLGYLTYSS